MFRSLWLEPLAEGLVVALELLLTCFVLDCLLDCLVFFVLQELATVMNCLMVSSNSISSLVSDFSKNLQNSALLTVPSPLTSILRTSLAFLSTWVLRRPDSQPRTRKHSVQWHPIPLLSHYIPFCWESSGPGWIYLSAIPICLVVPLRVCSL